MKKRFAVVALLGLAFSLLIFCQSKQVTSAKVYMQQEKWDKAIEQLELAVQLYPNDAEAHYLLGKGYAVRGEREKMNEMFDQSLKLSPKFEQQIKAIREKY